MDQERIHVIIVYHVQDTVMDFIWIERKAIVNRIFNVSIIVLSIIIVVHLINDSIEISVDVHQLIKFLVSVSVFSRRRFQLIIDI